MADKLEVISKLQLGLTVAEVAKLTGETQKTVARIQAEGFEKKLLADSPTVMTHEERAARRKAIADYVQARKGTKVAIAEAARKFNITVKQVRRFSAERGIRLEGATRDPQSQKAPQMVVLAAIVGQPDANDRELAEQLAVSKQYVNGIRRLANQSGVLLAIERQKEQAVKESQNGKPASGQKSAARRKKK